MSEHDRKPPRTPMHQRPTAREIAASSTGEDAWTCPRCGCNDWRVVNSYMATGERKRRRVCRHCGQELLRTSEVPVPDGYKIKVVPIDDEKDEAA